jgi:hypothetical protein
MKQKQKSVRELNDGGLREVIGEGEQGSTNEPTRDSSLSSRLRLQKGLKIYEVGADSGNNSVVGGQLQNRREKMKIQRKRTSRYSQTSHNGPLGV